VPARAGDRALRERRWLYGSAFSFAEATAATPREGLVAETFDTSCGAVLMVLTVSPETWPSATTQLRQCLSSPDSPLSSYSASDGLPPVPSTTWSRFSTSPANAEGSLPYG
jgi:hypothetical protein